MSNYYGYKKDKTYFEGWYFKHQTQNDTLCFIPGMHIDENKQRKAFIQVITTSDSYYIEYPFSEFKACKNRLGIKINNNIFMRSGIKINIETNDLNIKGEIRYGRFSPVKYDVMGPFKYFQMQCNHGILSMRHKIVGSLSVNNKQLDFNNGMGYIEKDWGTSFPKSYLWIQCNYFKDEKCAIMVSIADIPFGGLTFKGCIVVIQYKDREFRFATYSGAKILSCSINGFTIKQGRYMIKAEIIPKNTKKLLAPSNGQMKRTINESVTCYARFYFFIDGFLIFDLESDYAGFEFVK